MSISILNHPNLAEIMRDRHKTEMLLPERGSLSIFPPCEIRILMVTDGGGSFGSADFGLGELIDVLTTSTGPHERFVITRAHRLSGDQADIEHFRFHEHDLGAYDEIWLFGVNRNTNGALSAAELKDLATFMDGGGGVFATGDHEDLGLAMCGRVPRVRNMRKWYWPDAGPNGEPVAPVVDGAARHDTLVRRGDDDLFFENQSDDIPQTIQPKMYSRRVGMTVLNYPHPVLCGPNGPITVMPDHPHEGECYEPNDLDRTFEFEGAEFVEYPSVADQPRPKPEVIAFSTHGTRRNSDVKGALSSKTFGGIGVYDGHQANVGRVLVDATWHHFFNINLVGAIGAAPPFDKGFASSKVGRSAYEEIKAYFRNIATYLAPEPCHSRMRFLVGFWARWHNLIDPELRLVGRDNITSQARVSEFWRIGQIARGLYGRFASRDQTLSWAWGWVLPNERKSAFNKFSSGRTPTTKIMYEFEQDIEAVIHGAVLYGIADRFQSKPDTSDLSHVNPDQLEREIREEVCVLCRTVAEVLIRDMTRGRREVARVVKSVL